MNTNEDSEKTKINNLTQNCEENQSFIVKIESDNESVRNENNSLMCRICHFEESSPSSLIRPCNCTGTLQNVHQKCLKKWISMKGLNNLDTMEVFLFKIKIF